MRQANTGSLINTEENIQSLQSIPPGCQQDIKGIFNVKIHTLFLNTYRQKIGIKCKFWGMQREGLAFKKIDESTKQLSLSIRSKIQSLSNYLNDMKLLCIQVYTHPEQLSQEKVVSERRIKAQREIKQIGWIFVNLGRYIISHILNNFQENVNIVDLRKQKIGEAKVIVTLEMFKQGYIPNYQRQSEVKINQAYKELHLENEHIEKEKKINYQHQPKKNQIIPNRDPGHRHPIDQSLELEKQFQRQKEKIKMENYAFNQIKKKGKAELFLQQYERKKPEHSQLSLIRQKYGFNLPSVQVMKLKYDEARLLSKDTQIILKQDTRVNLLLKSIKLQAKQKVDHLTIFCEQRQKKVRTQTKIVLPQQVTNQKIQINYLYTIPNNPLDILVFQLKDAKFQAQISQILKSDKIQLKGKNNKKIASIDYTLISENGVKKSKIMEVNDTNQQKQHISKGKITKQHAYINVLNWREDKIILKNKNFGLLRASKILFEVNEPHSLDFAIQLQNENGQISHINLNLLQLFKEQNYIVNGHSVKIITSKGQLSQILSLLQKLQPEKLAQNKEIAIQQKHQEDSQKDEIIKQLVKVYTNLEECQDFQCHQLLQELTSFRQINKKKLQKFASIIKIDYNILKKVLSNIFCDNFQKFFTSFRVFHDWNHKYKQLQKKLKNIIESDTLKSNLLKTIKKIKRSSEIMFGLISQNYFLNEFIRQASQNQRIGTEHLENEIDFEQIGKLIIFVFERYHNRFIKISEVEEFVCQHKKYQNLNSYLLLKIVQQIIREKQQFSQHLNEETDILIQIFNSKFSHPIQFGLAKLLLTSQDDLVEDSILSIDENGRKYTQQNVRKQTQFREQVFKFKTQQSKQPFHRDVIKLEQEQKHRQEYRQKQLQDDSISKIQLKNITVIIKRVFLLNNQQVCQISLTSQNENIVMSNQMLQFPRAINLIENMVYNVRVKSNQQEYQGVFVANVDPKKIKLYRKQKQYGFIQLFGKNKNISQQSQVVIKLTSQQISFPQQRKQYEQLNYIPKSYQQINIKEDEATCPKSSLVKMVVRSIHPTRTHFALQITNESNGQSKRFDFPKQNQIVLSNSPKGWKLNLVSESYEQITVLNHRGSNKYCFVDTNTQKVGYFVVIEIEQLWNSSSVLDEAQSLHICLNFDRFLSLKQFQSKTYNLLLQVDKDIFQIGSMDNTSKSRILQSQISYKLTKRTNQIIAKLICNQTKVQVCSFKFMPKLIQKGIEKSQRFLMADQNGYRLKITIYQLRNEWKYFRPDKIINLFTYPNKKTIESFIHQNASMPQQKLTFWLKSSFQLTLGQIQILFNDVFAVEPGKYMRCLQKMFGRTAFGYCQNITDILDEFIIFDLTQKGIISQTQVTLIKRILERNFKQVHTLLNQSFQTFRTCSEIQGNFIVDLSKIQSNKDFDYLSFLSLFQDSLQAKRQIIPIVDKKNKEWKSKYLSLKLLSFNKLSINGAPSTLLFKINGVNLAEPIHRCYSHSYSNPSQILIKNDGNQYLQIFSQKLSTQGNWQYKLVQKVVLSKEIKILGGTINFQLKQTNQKGEQMVKVLDNTNKKKENEKIQKIERKENEPVNIDKQQDFSKSFWNKSLNQTRQKWLNANKSGTGKKESRRQPELDRQQIKKKMSFFNKEWDD